MNQTIRLLILIGAVGGLILLNARLTSVRDIKPTDRATAPRGGSTSYRLDWASAGEISGGDSNSTGYRLSATIGQMGAGTQSTSANYTLCVGFQCAESTVTYRGYLPLVLR
jgi:hypothetical protein